MTMNNESFVRDAIAKQLGDLILANFELTAEIQRLRALVAELQSKEDTPEGA